MKKQSLFRMFMVAALICCVLLSFSTLGLAGSEAGRFVVPQRFETSDGITPEDTGLNTENPKNKEKKDITVMVYMCGSDLESEYGAATNDIIEMACSGFRTDKVQLLVMTGGSSKWFIPNYPDGNNVWDIRPDILSQLYMQKNPQNWSEFAPLLREAMTVEASDVASNMGVPQTLSEFLNYVHEYYPSNKYALILWDHGGGPINGVCVDRLFNNDTISVTELKESLKNSSFAEEKLEWIGFDACLMASAEVALQIAPYAKYMVCSEETEPGCGWNYDFLETIDQDENGLETCKRIIDSYAETIQEIEKRSGNTHMTVTLSCIDLEKIGSVQEASENAFRVLNSGLTKENYAEHAKARKDSTGFGRAESAKMIDMDLVDLGDYIDHIFIEDEEIKESLKEAISAAVVYSKSNIEGATGLTAYFPYYFAKGFPGYFDQGYQKISLSGSYYDFIKRFNKIQTGQPQANFSGISTGIPPLGHKDVRTLLNVALTAEQKNALSEAHLLVFEKDDAKEAYALVSYVPEVGMEENTLTAEYVHRALFITDFDGSCISPALPYTALDDGRYAVEATLIRNDETGNEMYRKKVLLYLSMNDKNGAISIGNIYGYDDFTNTYLPRYSLNLEDFDKIEFVRSLRTIKEFGNKTLCAWEEWDEIDQEVYTLSLKDDRLMMLHNKIPAEKLNAGFLLCDYQNNRYISALIALEASSEKSENTTMVQYDDLETATITGTQFKIRENGNKSKANLSMSVTNLTDQEVIFILKDLKINGEEEDLTTEVNGTGNYKGLKAKESQLLMLTIPSETLQKYDAITSVTFILSAENAESKTNYTDIPVMITLNQDLSFMK